MRLGIDFGTTRTAVAYCDRGRYPLVSFWDARGDASEWLPSVGAETQDGALHFGFVADARSGQHETKLVRSLKRALRGQGSDAVRIPSSPTAGELVTRFLRHLRAQVQARLALPAEEPLEAVIAVPANAHSAQRFATLSAFRAAGFSVRGMLNEPSAAGFEYTHRHRNSVTARRENIVVYDLGGGTFDVSLVRMHGMRHEVVRTSGVSELGGDDFDAVMLDLLVDQLGLRMADLSPALRAILLDRCRQAKEQLHPSSRKIVLEVPELGQDEVVLKTAEYYFACDPLVQRTLETLSPVVSSVSESELAGIYVVGGASALPCIGRVLRERYGRRIHRSSYPFAACAIGLAIAADASSEYRLQDRLSRHVGVFREAKAGRDIAFDVILDKQAILSGGLESRRRYRAAHNVGHFRFVECSDIGTDGTPRGDITPYADVFFPFDRALQQSGADLRTAPVARIADGPAIEECYRVDEHGVVSVTLSDLESGFERTFRLDELH